MVRIPACDADGPGLIPGRLCKQTQKCTVMSGCRTQILHLTGKHATTQPRMVSPDGDGPGFDPGQCRLFWRKVTHQIFFTLGGSVPKSKKLWQQMALRTVGFVVVEKCVKGSLT